MKAKNVRWRIQKGDWQVMHVPGAGMPADMGTKALAAQRLEELKGLTGMVDLRKEMKEEEEVKRDEKKGEGRKIEELEAVLRMIVVATSISMAKGQGEEGKEDAEKTPWEMFVVFAMATWGCISMLWWIWKVFTSVLERKRFQEEELRERVQKELEREVVRKEEERTKPERRTSTSHKAPDRVPSSSASSADPQGNMEERREVIKREGDRRTHESMMNEPRPPVPQRSEPSFRILVTDWGNRYHVNDKCPSLANSRRLAYSPWCPNCTTGEFRKGTKVKTQGPGRPAHTQKWCGEGRMYQACSHCVTDETA